MIAVFIVEDIEDTQLMLQHLIKNTDGFTLCGSAASAEEALSLIPPANPDVVIMDLGLPGISGIECIAMLKPRFPKIQFLVFTISEEDEHIFDSIKAGATSYIVKSSTPNQMRQAIEDVYTGSSPISGDIARKIINYFQKQASNNRYTAKSQYGISKREEEMLQYLAQGLTYQEVADKMFISLSTLKTHIYNTYEKLQVKNKVAAINRFFGNG